MNAPVDLNKRNVVGKSIAHDSSVMHVTGRAQYLDDLPEPPHMLHAALVI